MKRITNTMCLMLAFVLMSSTFNRTNAQSFEEGKNYLSIGYGYELFSVKRIFETYEDEAGFNVKGFGPITAKYEHGLSDKVGIGLVLGYGGATISWRDENVTQTDDGTEIRAYKYEYKNKKITGVARINWHLGSHDKIDPYIGLGLGFKSNKFTLSTNDANFDESELNFNLFPMSMSASFGCRFYFTDNIGAFIELGMGHGFAQGGLQVKF
ncbi:MAG TPA: hypothetical protein VIK71_03745 [Flavobacteriales bacterium]|jgi:opacity protein-like surface antigen